MASNTCTVLLTAAITPAPGVEVALADPQDRLRQYREALSFWCGVAAYRDLDIWVVETSGADPQLLLSQLGLAESAKVTFRSAPAQQASAALGKGAIEADAVDTVIRELAAEGAGRSVYKVTGRLQVRNPGTVLTELSDGHAVARRTLDRSYCDTRFVGATVAVWHTWLSDMGPQVDDGAGRYLEHVVASRLAAAEFAGVVVDRFSRRPQLHGVSATRGESVANWRHRLVDTVDPLAPRMLGRLARVRW
ncbi:hypothetical protein ACMYYO_04630 [Dermacoccaceae bacterium W4C1]